MRWDENPLPPGARRSVRHLRRHWWLDEASFTKRGARRPLENERWALGRLDGMPGVPRVVGFEARGERADLSLARIDGRRLDLVELPLARLLGVLGRALLLLVRLARRGLRHGDLRMENWLLDRDGRLHLVDFEHAEPASLWRSLTTSLAAGGGRTGGSGYLGLARSWLRDRLPPALLRRMAQPPALTPPLGGPIVDAERLRTAWRRAAESDASSPGTRIAYHRLRIADLDLPGERDFATRWRQIAAMVDLADRRVLEVGCNLALLSIFALRAGAVEALAVDRDDAILRAAAEAARALGVRPRLEQLDLDAAAAWERSLATFRADLVVALSVVHWLHDPERTLRFLASQPLVVYEGHESAERERRRLLAAGFDDVERVLTTERGRALFLCHGSRAPGTPAGG